MVIRVYCDYVNKRGLRPLLFISSPLLVKERGTKGVRLTKTLIFLGTEGNRLLNDPHQIG